MNWKRALNLEQDVALLQSQQELNGVGFDVVKAWDTLEILHDELEQLKQEILKEAPKRVTRPYSVPVNRPFLKSGGYAKPVLQWLGDDAETCGGPFTRIEWEELNLHSPQQVKTYLLSLGWKPTEWNYKKDGKRIVKDEHGKPIKTSPKLTEDSYGSLPEGVGRRIARYNVVDHRRSLIYNIRRDGSRSGWLNNLREEDGVWKVTAEAIPQATPTGRYRHKIVVNVPKAKPQVIYGKEMRELFIPTQPGWVMGGVDAKALEARIEGHYTAYYDGGVYANELLEGDPHTKNANAFSEALGKEVIRDIAKNIKYALLYGAQPPKVAETAGCSLAGGKKLYDAFWANNPALEGLKRDVDKNAERRGYLIGIDGRKLFFRSPHSRLNLLFQNAGSVTVKQATRIMWGTFVPENGLRARIMVHQHDEWQGELPPEETEIYTELSLNSFVQAGQDFNLNIPIEGDVTIGNNWAETH